MNATKKVVETLIPNDCICSHCARAFKAAVKALKKTIKAVEASGKPKERQYAQELRLWVKQAVETKRASPLARVQKPNHAAAAYSGASRIVGHMAFFIVFSPGEDDDDSESEGEKNGKYLAAITSKIEGCTDKGHLEMYASILADRIISYSHKPYQLETEQHIEDCRTLIRTLYRAA